MRDDNYELVHELGVGGMATVYFARPLGGGGRRPVAVKRLHPHLARDPALVAMFLGGTRVGALLRHPNVVAVHEVCRSADGPFLVMDLVDGLSLATVLDRLAEAQERLPAAVTARVMLDMLAGLQAAHELRDPSGAPLALVRCDVSPPKVLVGGDGVTRLGDFGIARTEERFPVTRVEQRQGKRAYMAPEELRAEVLDRRADVYGAGLVLWESLTGRRAFPDGASRSDADVITSPREVEPTVPAALETACMQALATRREHRFATAAAFADAIERACAEDGVDPAPSREIGELIADLVAASPVPVRASAGERLTRAFADERVGPLLSSVGPLRGRDAELERLTELFGRARLVTLSGPIGVGKTRLAAAWCEGARGEAVWCSLAEAVDEDAVWRGVAASLGLASPGATDEGERLEATGCLERISAALGSRSVAVLVLDGLDAARPSAIERLWQHAPALRILVTSRRRLGVEPEHVVDVGPLDTRDCDGAAVKLFCDVAERHGHRPDPARLADVLAVVRALDGLPLAIELVAARTRVLNEAQIASRLERPLALLGDAGRGRSLGRALVEAWDALNDAERALLDACAVFRGGLTMEAIDAVALLPAGAPAPLDVVAALRDRSLLVRAPADDGGSLRLTTLAVVRDFVVERSDPVALAAARDRHGAYFARAGQTEVASLFGPRSGEASAWLRAEVDNLWAAHAWLASRPGPRDAAWASQLLALLVCLDEALRLHSAPATLLPVMDATLDAVAGASPADALLARAHLGRGRLRRTLAVAGAEDDFAVAEALAARAGDRALTGLLLSQRCYLRRLDHDLDAAMALGQAALAALEGAGAPVLRALAVGVLGDVHRARGELEPARDLLGRAIAGFRAAGDARLEGVARLHLGKLLAERDDRAGAAEQYARAEPLLEGRRDRQYLGMLHASRGALLVLEGALAAAEAAYRRALAELDTVGDVRHASIARAELAGVLASEGRLAEAEECLAEAERVLGEVGDARRLAVVRARHAHLVPAPRHALVVAPEGRSFCWADGAAVDLARHPALARILWSLVTERLAHPGAPLALEAVVGAGWPGERLRPTSAASRAYVALSTLRKRGLRAILLRGETGYYLDPHVDVRIVAP
jgi:predicted ATPase